MLPGLSRGITSSGPIRRTGSVGKLERKLGVALLERTSRRLTLTPAGTVLLEQGRIAVEVLGAAVERTRRQGTRADRLTVAVKADGSTGLLKKIAVTAAYWTGTDTAPAPRQVAIPAAATACAARTRPGNPRGAQAAEGL
ncbi:MAG: LysR family transcriptional regulator [Streptosporangiaceae bacterium]